MKRYKEVSKMSEYKINNQAKKNKDSTLFKIKDECGGGPK